LAKDKNIKAGSLRPSHRMITQKDRKGHFADQTCTQFISKKYGLQFTHQLGDCTSNSVVE
jgi:hypothetical protein